MEPLFGRDFSRVRIHTGGRAAESAHAVQSLAYTVGPHVVFGGDNYRPETASGRRLLAHELTHVLQQGGQDGGIQEELEVGAPDTAAEREADATADSVIRQEAGPHPSHIRPVLQRQTTGTLGWSGAKGVNSGKNPVKTMQRIPLDHLSSGEQFSKSGPSGRAIVVLPASLDLTKPVDVLLHFHGHNAGYDDSSGSVRDDAVDNIEGQMAASSHAQLVGVLPQGTADSSFGQASIGGKKTTKAFNADSYLDEVFSTLVSLSVWTAKPARFGVMISGHSGAGELINEKLLGSVLGSAIGAGATSTAGSSLPGSFKELALIDAVNGPKEHARLSEFLKMKMADELAKTLAQTKESDKVAYLNGSFKFRGYYSHGPNTKNYYSQWYVGPVVSSSAVYKESIQDLITKFLTDNLTALGGSSSPVYKAFKANYQIFDAGTGDHDKVVGANDHLQDAISVLPKGEEGSQGPALVPASVIQTLRASGRPLDGAALSWANGHFHRDLSDVRIHDDGTAAESTRSIHAQAYTVGRDIVFNRGRFSPVSEQGKRLLAHELTHVIQQGGAEGLVPSAFETQRDALEHQADRAAEPAAARALEGGVSGRRIQRDPDPNASPKTVDAAMCEANANPNPAALGTCSYKEPENCPTYEGWISTFTALKTFTASDTPETHPSNFPVIGGGAAAKDFRPLPKGATPAPAPPPKGIAPLKPGERFIDHPTDDWVKTCLPENLRATAYQLPADCADIAMILRHVWLAAHHRTQVFGGWVLGSEAGKAMEKDVLNVISNAGTEQVANLVAPYSDAQGHPLRSIKDLAPLLHAGDILVWWHYEKGFDKGRTGGHTHTISQVDRDESGALKGLILLQGNEPLFGRHDPNQPVSPANPARQKEDIQDFLKKENPKVAPPDDKTLGTAPGRRIEKVTAATSGLTFKDSDPKTDKSPAPIWKWGTETLLVAAGPPKSAQTRPPMVKQPGQKGPLTRKITDWTSALKGAPSASELTARFESMLFEARATVEGGGSLQEAEAREVGTAAGSAIWEMGKKAKDLGNVSHFQPMQDILDILWAFQNSREILSRKADSPADDITFRLFDQLGWIKEAFELAARGASNVQFRSGVSPKTDAVNVLVTGFDPFEPTGSLKRPGKGEWNPAGAAALALDGQRVPVTASKTKGVAAVESVVLPVSFTEFKEGIVEKIVGAHTNEVDAVLTVSEDAGLDPSQPVRLERYSVGVHSVQGSREGIPAAGTGGAGPAIIETNAPVKDISTAVGSTKADPAAPTIGEQIVFRFPSVIEADGALTALGLPAQKRNQVSISDEKALQQIISTMTRKGDSPDIQFKAGTGSFSAQVISGPGGDFLSNEVAFRTQRLLGASGSANPPLSFHTHTQKSDTIPEDQGTAESKKARKDALADAKVLLGRIIDTLKRIIGAVGRLVLDKRAASKSKSP